MNLCFFGWEYIWREGKVKFSKIFRGLLIKASGSDRFRIFFFFFGGGGEGLGKKGWGQYFMVRLIPWRTLCKTDLVSLAVNLQDEMETIKSNLKQNVNNLTEEVQKLNTNFKLLKSDFSATKKIFSMKD